MCASSEKHSDHKIVAVVKILQNRKRVLQKDLQELGKIIHPKYQEIASSIFVQKADLNEMFKNLSTAVNKREKVFLSKIKDAINKLKTILNNKRSKYLAILKKAGR